MKGLELSEKYYNETGKPVLEKDFGDVMPFLAVGLVGSGSECFGFDDETSVDHDFEPSFCIFIPDDENIVSSQTAFRLERTYKSLQKDFCGYKVQGVSPAGGSRRGVIRIGDFYQSKTGHRDGSLSLEEWCTVSEFFISEAVNGKIFFDNYGKFSEIRRNLSSMPRDALLKRLAGNLAAAAQSGEYNYLRCISHGETAAAQLTLFEFEKAAVNSFFLINETYQPYFKWKYRALRSFPDSVDIAEKLEFLISSPNGYDNIDSKLEIIASVTNRLVKKCTEKYDLQNSTGLEGVSFALNDKISDVRLRNESIFYCV